MSADKLGNVVEGNDVTFGLGLRSLTGHANGEVPIRAQTVKSNLVGDEAAPLFLRTLQQRPKFGDRLR